MRFVKLVLRKPREDRDKREVDTKADELEHRNKEARQRLAVLEHTGEVLKRK